jgi:hypothetical protein
MYISLSFAHVVFLCDLCPNVTLLLTAGTRGVFTVW